MSALQLICLFLITCSNSSAPQIKLEKKGTEIIGPHGKKQTIASVGKKPDFMSLSIDDTTGLSYKMSPIHQSQQIDIDTGVRMYDHVNKKWVIVKDVYFSARPGGEKWIERVPHVIKDPDDYGRLLNVGKVSGRRIPYQQMNVMLQTLWDNNVPMWVHHLINESGPAEEVEIKPKYELTVKFGNAKVELKEVSVDWINEDFEIKKGDSCDFMEYITGMYKELYEDGPFIFKEIKKGKDGMEAVFTSKPLYDVGKTVKELTKIIYDEAGIKVNGKWIRKWVPCYTRVRFDATPLIHIRFVTVGGIGKDSLEISGNDKVVFKNLGTTEHRLTKITGDIGAGTAIAHFLEIDLDDEVIKYPQKTVVELLFSGKIKVNGKKLGQWKKIPKSENAPRSHRDLAHFGDYGDVYYESDEFVESDGYDKEYVNSNVGYGWLKMLLVVFLVCVLICIMAFSWICGCFIGGYFTKYVMTQDKNVMNVENDSV